MTKHDVETFKCEKCEKIFYLKWRMEKHMNIHSFENIKYCHCFNNSKQCPFEEVGCMFKHERSRNCRFKKNCRNKLCQFQHVVTDETTDTEDDQINTDDNLHTNNSEKDSCEDQENLHNVSIDDHSESETEEEDLECDECGKISENFDAYIEHRGKGDCVFWCNYCDKFFRQEVDLQKHIEKHCKKCSKTFPTKNAVNKHMTNCNSIE